MADQIEVILEMLSQRRSVTLFTTSLGVYRFVLPQRYTTPRCNVVVTLCVSWAMSLTVFKQRCVDVVYDTTLPQLRWPLDATL